MVYTYNEILERMTDTFEELAGYEVEKASDVGIRMKVLAGEIYSLGTSIDWLKKQMFPTTATGEQLDMHASQRGLSRNKGKKAYGILSFKIDNPVDYEFTIPKGTICSTSDGKLRFTVSQDVTIAQGGTLATVRADAVDTGKIYNVGHDEITTIITYFSVGLRIYTSSIFIGGEDDEDDESLRKRIMLSLQNIPNGANKAYYISLATDVEGVQSAAVIDSIDSIGHIEVYAAGRGSGLNATVLSEVKASISQNHCAGISANVYSAQTQAVDVYLTLYVGNGYNFDEVSENVREAVKKFFLDKNVGDNLILAELGEVIFHIDGVENYKFNNMSDQEFNLRTLPVFGDITISRPSGGASS